MVSMKAHMDTHLATHLATTTHPHHHAPHHDDHHIDRNALARLHATIAFGLIGIGLALCAFGAIAFDIVHLFGDW
jgi:hypothetical protein